MLGCMNSGAVALIFVDEMVDTRSFAEKMKGAEERNNSKTIITWEDFNAS